VYAARARGCARVGSSALRRYGKVSFVDLAGSERLKDTAGPNKCALPSARQPQLLRLQRWSTLPSTDYDAQPRLGRHGMAWHGIRGASMARLVPGADCWMWPRLGWADRQTAPQLWRWRG
jgi:hypothetical protein